MKKEFEVKIPETVAVIDSDEAGRNLSIKFIKDLGVNEIEVFDDGESFLDVAKEKSFDAIVMDWKLPKIGGLALFNRIKMMDDYADSPILVTSGFIEKQDFQLLSEFGMSSLLEKPFDQEKFEKAFYDILAQWRWNLNFKNIYENLLKDEEASSHGAIELMHSAPDPISMGLMGGRLYLRRKQYDEAIDMYSEVIALERGNIMALTGLGKCYFLQGKHEEAIRELGKANTLSARNIERLCIIGESQLNLKAPHKAKRAYGKILSLDGSNEDATQGLEVSTNMESFMEENEEAISPEQSIASILNMAAIAKVRTRKFSEGVEQYEAALKFVKDKSDRARLTFNLGLAYVRAEDKEKAVEWFEKSAEFSKGTDFDKAGDYIERLSRVEPISEESDDIVGSNPLDHDFMESVENDEDFVTDENASDFGTDIEKKSEQTKKQDATPKSNKKIRLRDVTDLDELAGMEESFSVFDNISKDEDSDSPDKEKLAKPKLSKKIKRSV